MAAAEALQPWQAAAPRRKGAPRRRRRRSQGRARGPEEPEIDGGAVLRRLREAEEDLRISDFCSAALGTITQCLGKQQEQLKVGTLSEALRSLCLDPSTDRSGQTQVIGSSHVKCVCYGLGNFASCVNARIQLTFLLLLLEKCQIPRQHCCVYDPLFSQVETSVLTALGLTVLSDNEEGKHSICGEPTIFYMPHCGTALYNNLLWSNWSEDALSRIVIIGNSFSGLRERLLTRVLLKSYPYVAKSLQGLEECALPPTPYYMDTFNDTSVHWFPVARLQALPGEVLAFREEPEYEDCEELEIIRKEATDPPCELCAR